MEFEHNLEHEGNCWIYDNAKVIGKAVVSEEARVYGNSVVCDYAHVCGKAIIDDNSEIHDFALEKLKKILKKCYISNVKED